MQNVYDEEIMHALTELFPISYGLLSCLLVPSPLPLSIYMNLAIMAVRVSRNLLIPIGRDALHFVESPMIRIVPSPSPDSSL